MPTELSAGPADLDAVLGEAELRARHLGRPVLVSVTRRVPARDPAEVFAQAAQASAERAVWLRPAAGESLVGVGAAHILVASGPRRYDEVGRAWQDLLRDALVDNPDRLASTGPLLLGGFAFDPGRAAAPHWSAFPPARLVLPATLVSQRHGRAWQTTNVLVPPPWQNGNGRSTTSASGYAVPMKETRSARRAMRTADTWQALVGSAVRGIRDGSLGLEKLVVAREAHVVARDRLEPEVCLRRLAGEYPTCTVFAVAQQDACFLGATPERLAQAHHGAVSTMALAGSIARGATPEEDRLLGERLRTSPKERAEHAIVVRALREALAASPDVCSSVTAELEPCLAQLPNVQHLLTPIHAQLAPGKTLLDLVARLHPSPAVAGFPRAAALEVIRQREGFDRGWYGGPLGWLSAAGDGEFVVAIRSGLLRGREAWLYAGCGIVADSDPAAEYAESELKLRPMRSALGFSCT